MITNKMKQIIKILKMFPVFLLEYVKFIYRLITLTFLISIISLISDYINYPKPYFYFLFIIIYLIVYSYKNRGCSAKVPLIIHVYKVSLISSIKKLVLYIIIAIPFAFFCLYLLDTSIAASLKEVDEKTVYSTADTVKKNIGEAAPALAGAGVGKQIIKTHGHKGPVTSTAAGAAGDDLTVLAVGTATAVYKGLSQNKQINTQLDEVAPQKPELALSTTEPKDVLNKGAVLENNTTPTPSPSPSPTPTPSPSPSPSSSFSSSSDGTGGGFIQSPFESEIPLVSILENILMLNIIELGFISIIMYLILRGFLNSILKFLILKLLSYIVKNKDELFNKEEKINKIFDNLAKHNHYAIVFLITLLIVLKFTTLYFMFYLTEDIDSFVKVYNYLTKK